ncbi:MAG: DNA-binding protein [Chloroflexi bacterium HGW-Chloroflexi-3]|nr:MAG: DNA-binding protein [Chloroflexi bacterium HGW-Chloroflexi-3]
MNNQSKSSENDLSVGIPKPALRVLEAAGFKNLTDFTLVSEEELLKLHGIGPKAVRIISAAMETQGLHFANKENSNKISEKANQKIAGRK